MDFDLFWLHRFDDKIMNVRKMKEKECSWNTVEKKKGYGFSSVGGSALYTVDLQSNG